jgi:hypothetical protein
LLFPVVLFSRTVAGDNVAAAPSREKVSFKFYRESVSKANIGAANPNNTRAAAILAKLIRKDTS